MEHFATAFAALLLFAALPATESARSHKLPPIAVDSTGAELIPGVHYYALLADGNKGGLDLTPAHPKPCPMDVVEDLSPVAAQLGGLQLSFSQMNPNDTSPIRTSTDINVVFEVVNMCSPQSMVWKLGKFNNTTGKRYLTSGGTLGKPGRATVSSWFKLQKVDNVGSGAGTAPAVYKVVFCPHVCRYCKVVCGDIGVAGGDALKRKLGISNVPLLLSFRKG